MLVGPRQSPDPGLESLGRVVLKGPVDYKQLSYLARGVNVLVMPYADRSVTRAMQPLKLK